MSHRNVQLSGIVRTIVARFIVEIPPTIAMGTSITEVKLSPDLQYADIYVSAIKGLPEAIEYLKLKKGPIRKGIATEINAHTVPTLRFRADDRGEKADKLDKLIESL
ncbi:MAG: ribosome-binding factor A [Candidatus Peribacteraceae bacterium]|nr:ribosome-binding factor A [Candidatus Peribacteraceae bacterium]MBP9850559.1 ribosome-binding factor A [Candidatus Peribacteraceae bacterium]